MNQNQASWHQPLRFLIISGMVFVSSQAAIVQGTGVANAQLQLIPDGTLGNNQRSIVTPYNPDPRIDLIEGGAQRGANLFHSFREFNVDVGRGVYFTNPVGITNILARVTGGNSSQILSTLGVLGSANLFLINPNGILFGSNAQLDIRGGSFIASTANSILFNNGFAFSATNPQAPPLLTVNVPAGLQYGSNPGAIQTQGVTLQVQNGQTLTLAGGAVTIDGGQLLAPGGRVELASVAAPGTVGLTQQGQEWQLRVPDGLGRADVAIGNNASVKVLAGGGGNIAITARNLEATGTGTFMQAGIETGLGNINAQAGNIDINATEAVTINASIISNAVLAGGTGNAGDVRITTGILSLFNRAQVNAPTLGQGNAGNIIITARDAAFFDGVGSDGNPSGAFSTVRSGAIGRGGDVRITTGSLEVRNGAQIQTSTFGQGDAGDVIIQATNQVVFAGGSAGGSPSAAFSSVGDISFNGVAEGNGGNVEITTNSLEVRNGARLQSSTLGRGNAGSVIIKAAVRVLFDNGIAFSTVGLVDFNGVAEGNGGNVEITTNSLEVRNGASLQASTFGQGNAGSVMIQAGDRVVFNSGTAFSSVGGVNFNGVAVGNGGNVEITTNSLEVLNGAALVANTFGRGDAGSVLIQAADQVLFAGTSADGEFPSAAFSNVGSVNFNGVAEGNGGDIRITTNSLEVRNGASLTASTLGKGNGGNVIIQAADRVVFAGISANERFSSGAFSTVGDFTFNGVAEGNGRDIRITTNSLEVRDGAQLVATTFNKGDAGNIQISANTVALEGVGSTGYSSGLFTSTLTGASGRGGEIAVYANSLRLTDGAVINAQTFNASIGGTVTLNANTFAATRGGQVVTTTLSSGQAGNIILNVSDRITLSGADPTYAERLNRFGSIVSNQGATSGFFANTAPNSTGRGGTIEITTRRLNIADSAGVGVDSQGSGVAGNINISARSVQLNQGRLTAETNTVDGGNITLQNLDLLLLRNQSRISTTAGTTQAGGNGGNITFNGKFIVAAPNENSDISANAFTGRGGRVNITAQGLFGIQFRPQSTPLSDITASSTFGIAGVVDINTPNVDPNRGLVQLPTDLIDASRQIANACSPNSSVARGESRFTVTGRGGLPASPDEPQTRYPELDDLGSAVTSTQAFSNPNSAPAAKPVPEIVEAQGWITDSAGNLFLVARSPQVTPHSSVLPTINCRP